MLGSIAVKDYMSTPPITLTVDMPIMQAIKVLSKNNITGAPVLDLHGNLVGVLTQKDCLKVALNASYHGETVGSVKDFMVREVQTLDTDSSILDAIEVFIKFGYHRIPVMEDNRLIGVIGQTDILRAFTQLN
jgi:CBS domain-containing protein